MLNQVFQAPPAVLPGDRVAVIAPASAFDRASFEAGLALVASRYRIEYTPELFTRHRYLAGDDERRLAELLRALADPGVHAVLCARGGYGATRLLKSIGARGIRPAAKPLVGFSDITALHLWLQRQGLRSIHGPVLTQLGKLPAATAAHLFALLESTAPPPPLQGTHTYVRGMAEGPLLGGNLSVLSRLLGTSFMPEVRGAILLLEDTGERPYRLDRIWTHLTLMGLFERIAGIVLGEFTACEEKDADFSSAEVLRELAAATGLPCAAGFPIGHGAVNEPIPLGARVRLDADARRLTFLEAAVA
jgi:muramoyltetrapeptide carboxypeptidase